MGSTRSRRSNGDWRNLADVVIQAEAAQRWPVRRVIAALTLAGMLLIANAFFILNREPQAPPLFTQLEPFEATARKASRDLRHEGLSRQGDHHAAPSVRGHFIDHAPPPVPYF